MGIFGRLFSGQSSEDMVLNQREAFASVLLVTVAADGHISDEEAQTFNTVISRMQLFRAQGNTEFSAMIDKLMGLLRGQGASFLLTKAAASLPPELRDTAFVVAVDLVLADGHVEEKEKALLENIKETLKVSDELTMKVVEVLTIKNRG